MADLAVLQRIANQLRIESIRSTTAAGSGHPTSCCSAADLVAALFFNRMRFDPTDPRAPDNDRFVLSKGHAAPILYAAWAEAGHLDPDELDQLRQFASPLEGHPTPRLDFVDVATGSLGQGLSAGLGMALSARIDRRGFVTYVLLGDGELAEGSVWEAASLAGVRKLDNLVAIADINRLGQSQPTAFGWNVDVYQRRFEAAGWRTVIIDGHDLREITEALDLVGKAVQPLAIIARTIKGKGIPGVEDALDWHGKPLSAEKARETIDHLQPNAIRARDAGVRIPRPSRSSSKASSPASAPPMKRYSPKDKVATRKAFGDALARIGASFPNLVVLDGDVENSTYTSEFAERYKERFFECFIAEQNMIGAATGLAARGKLPFASTFAAFFSRAGDQIRMAGISQSNVKLVGTHAGVSIGEDGPSQMGLEDLSFMRTIPGGVVLSPSDAVSTEKLVEQMARTRGPAYMRTARPATPVIYSPDEEFEIGGAKVLRQGDDDRVTVVATGVTVTEALQAYDTLAAEGISIAVIDAYSLKPLGEDVIASAMARTRGLVLTVEDHYPEGGLGDAVAGALSQAGARVRKLAVYELPHSGKKDELMRQYRIDARAIEDEVRAMIAEARRAPEEWTAAP